MIEIEPLMDNFLCLKLSPHICNSYS
jgi:hypothetical protein